MVSVSPTGVLYAQTRFSIENGGVVFTDGKDVLRTPSEGLWSVATGWKDDWMTDWTHVKASKVETTGAWTILKGRLPSRKETWNSQIHIQKPPKAL